MYMFEMFMWICSFILWGYLNKKNFNKGLWSTRFMKNDDLVREYL